MRDHEAHFAPLSVSPSHSSSATAPAHPHALHAELARLESVAEAVWHAHHRARLMASLCGTTPQQLTMDAESLAVVMEDIADACAPLLPHVQTLAIGVRRHLPALKPHASAPPTGERDASRTPAGDAIDADAIARRLVALAAEAEQISTDASQWLSAARAGVDDAGLVAAVEALMRMADHVALQWSTLRSEGHDDE